MARRRKSKSGARPRLTGPAAMRRLYTESYEVWTSVLRSLVDVPGRESAERQLLEALVHSLRKLLRDRTGLEETRARAAGQLSALEDYRGGKTPRGSGTVI